MSSLATYPKPKPQPIPQRIVLRKPHLPQKNTQTLFGLIAPGWQVVQPLLATTERDTDGSYLASEDALNMYGVGPTPAAAWQDLIASLQEYYELAAADAELDAPNKAWFQHIQQYLRKVG